MPHWTGFKRQVETWHDSREHRSLAQRLEPSRECRRQHSGDLGERTVRGHGLCGEQSAAAPGLDAEDDDQGLVVGEHQRRELVRRGEPVAAVPVALRLHRDAQVGEVLGVASHRPLVHPEPTGEVPTVRCPQPWGSSSGASTRAVGLVRKTFRYRADPVQKPL